MTRPDDDDPATIDWGPDADTSIDDRPPLLEADTAKYKSLEYAAGREAGFTEGVDLACAALIVELRRSGFSEAEVVRWQRRVRLLAWERG